jgi:predicted component of type VI protein secretion system
VLKAEDIPNCQLSNGASLGARLGWNTWLLTRAATVDAEDVVLEGVEVVRLDSKASA